MSPKLSDFANCFSQTSRNKNLRFHNSLNDFCKLAKVITWGKTLGVVGVEDAVLENIVENSLDQAANGWVVLESSYQPADWILDLL